MAPKKSAQTAYSKEDKTLRDQPLQGKPGKTIKAGFVVLFHGRRYALIEDTVIPESGRAYGRFRLQTTLS